MSLFDDVPASALPIVGALVKLIADLVRAGSDDAAQEEALMQAEQTIARERARRKFGSAG